MVFMLEVGIVAVACLIAEAFIVATVGDYDNRRTKHEGKKEWLI